eukprot:TRINITY_DN4114_c0_g1_i1.p1 TRINITY_DN4114_c0_g1~~TRINITY_DN4114_c0_g1_i1.p1  ORF type:complete len:298 (-),score=75.90 TRINITY_DN4114_c0_g1_i1:19-888(-)
MATPDGQALELELKADKKQTSFQIFGNKFEDAFELYTKAVSLFKLSKKWEEGGRVAKKAAQCQLKLGSKHEAATQYTDAANCYKKVSSSDAVDCLKLACEIYTDLGKFIQAARLYKDIASIFEGDMDLANACEYYEKAADFFQTEESGASASDCLLKVGLFSAQLEKYDRAVDIYEKVASDSIDNTLRKFSVRDYLLRAGICHLCTGDTITSRRALDRYREMDSSFGTSREGKLLEQLVDAVEAQDLDKFISVIHEFDSISKLDSWKTTMLLRIRKNISSAETVAGGIL